MANYDRFAKYYDKVMGDRNGDYEIVKFLIDNNTNGGDRLLEVACGTGALLEKFSDRFEVSGVDLSENMLEVARQKVKGAHLYNMDMCSFDIDGKFDVILCLFDSINHLVNYEDWESFFDNSYEHLEDGGILIFDINTVFRLNQMLTYSSSVYQIDDDYVLIKVTGIGENKVNWNVRFFENVEGNNYIMNQENILEASFPIEKILGSLNIFKEIKMVDSNLKEPTAESKRLYFVCKK